MKVLVACEYSGIVRDAFTARGHDAWSCDLLPTERPGQHYQGDILNMPGLEGFDLMIAHPPCDWVCVSGIHWNVRGRRGLSPRGCEIETRKAIRFAEILWELPIKKKCLENPIGVLSTRSKLGKPTQIIQPHQFGHDASKATCIWLEELDPLEPTEIVEPRVVNGKNRWSNQTDSGQNRLGPSETRWKERSTTYNGIAQAMATQWG